MYFLKNLLQLFYISLISKKIINILSCSQSSPSYFSIRPQAILSFSLSYDSLSPAHSIRFFQTNHVDDTISLTPGLHGVAVLEVLRRRLPNSWTCCWSRTRRTQLQGRNLSRSPVRARLFVEGFKAQKQ